MRTLVIHTDKRIDSGIELTHVECIRVSRLSDVAAVVDLNESPKGWNVIYQDGVTRMYDPVENVIIGAAQPHRGRVGWTS